MAKVVRVLAEPATQVVGSEKIDMGRFRGWEALVRK